jgi:hypothetical protein
MSLKSLLGFRTWIYSDPFLVNDSHLSAHYYQIRRCVETNEIDFQPVKHSPIVGIGSSLLPPDSAVALSKEVVRAIRGLEPARNTKKAPYLWEGAVGGQEVEAAFAAASAA